ncbi:MAG: DNA polymerase domain-containing protein [Thermoprotei archaeon]
MGYVIDAFPGRGSIKVILDSFRSVNVKTTFPIYVKIENPSVLYDHPNVVSVSEEDWRSFEGKIKLYRVEVDDVSALDYFKKKLTLYNTIPSPLSQAMIRLNLLPFRLVDISWNGIQLISSHLDFPQIKFVELRRYDWFGYSESGKYYRVFVNGKPSYDGEGIPRVDGDVVYCEGPCIVSASVFIDRASRPPISLKELIERSLASKALLREIAYSSVGKALTINEAWVALSRKFAVPSIKINVEDLKSLKKLREADRAGLTLFPRAGLYNEAYQLDFVSMYPSIIVNYNISPELLDCGRSNCPLGIVPEALNDLLERREILKNIDKERADAIKLMLVASFGYLGYRNSKFGRVETYEAVTNTARKALTKVIITARDLGLTVLHGIVDSIVVQGPRDVIERLMDEISMDTGLQLRIDAEFDWVAFTPNLSMEPHPQRYFGRVKGGKIKSKGVIKRNQPNLVKWFLEDLLNEASKGARAEDAKRIVADELPALTERYVKICFSDYPLAYVMTIRGVPFIRGTWGFYKAYEYRGHDPYYYENYVKRVSDEVRRWFL